MSIDQFLLSADTTDLNYPEIRPSLDLNFARTKTLDPRITFTRSSGGSYVGADGLIKYAGVNEARFDHDPVTGESLGLLIEEARTNLKLWSESIELDFFRASISTIIQNAIVSPDGTQTADGIVPSTTVSPKYIDKILTGFSASQNVCTSAFFKKGVGKEGWLQIYEESGNALQALRFDFDTKQLFFSISNEYNSGGGVTKGYGVIEYPNGWYRLWIAGYPNTTTTGRRIRIRLTNQTGAFDFTGDGISSYLYVWGVQCEIGSFPTSYIPTVASTRTRAVDNASITGKNFSEWYRQDEGTVYSSYITRVPANANQNNATFVIENETSTNRIVGWNNFVKQSVFSLVENNVANYVFSGSIFPKTNIPVKKIIGVQDSNVKIYVETDALIGDFASNVPDKTPRNLTRMFIGVGNGFSALNGTIARFTYFPKRLPNAQLQALTR